MLRSKLLAAAAIALPMMVAGATSAQANIIGLTIDESGSISPGDWTLQKQGYVNALNALMPSVYGQNHAIGVWSFDDTVRPIFAVQVINNIGQLNALTAAIAGMTQHQGATAIGNSILAATTAITGFAGANCLANPGKCLIDVSTDGVNNTGTDPATATTTANAAGVKVNCLLVGAGGNCGWNGTGLDFNATSFAQFEAAIKAKLFVELGLPEPITMSLFGAGLIGAAALRRRKNKTA